MGLLDIIFYNPYILLAIGILVFIIIGLVIVSVISFLCKQELMPESLKFLCFGSKAEEVLNAIVPSEDALCSNPIYYKANVDKCTVLENELYAKCTSQIEKDKIVSGLVTLEAKNKAIAEKIKDLKQKGVFLSKDKSKCLMCSGGYSRSFIGSDDSETACTNSTTPIKSTEVPKDAPVIDAKLLGSKNTLQLCKNKYPVSKEYGEGQVKVGTNQCYACPNGYQKILTKPFGSGKECKPDSNDPFTFFCGSTGFSGPITLTKGKLEKQCYVCPPGFSENKYITKVLRNRMIFFERGCVNRTIGTDQTPYKKADEYKFI
mgnify:CR=1 FL=1